MLAHTSANAIFETLHRFEASCTRDKIKLRRVIVDNRFANSFQSLTRAVGQWMSLAFTQRT